MSFTEAVRSVLRKYVQFSGRARRSEYWWWFLVYGVVYLVALVLDANANAGTTAQLAAVVLLSLFLPTLAVSVRRLHDTGRSGWWMLMTFIPVVGTILLIVWLASDSDETNRYGENPESLLSLWGLTNSVEPTPDDGRPRQCVSSNCTSKGVEVTAQRCAQCGSSTQPAVPA